MLTVVNREPLVSLLTLLKGKKNVYVGVGEEKDPSGTSRVFSNFLYSMNFEKSKSILVDKANLLLKSVDPKGDWRSDSPL